MQRPAISVCNWINLPKQGYIVVTKTFKGKMPARFAKITAGIDAEEYVEALKSYIMK